MKTSARPLLAIRCVALLYIPALAYAQHDSPTLTERATQTDSVHASTSSSARQGTLILPVLTMSASDHTAPPAVRTAAEMSERVKLLEQGFRWSMPLTQSTYSADSLRHYAAANAEPFRAQLEQRPPRGLQQDPASNIGVTAGDVAYAKAQIAARLATPGLSFADRAYALVAAVSAFNHRWAPDQLPTAEAYLRDLDVLGDSAASWQFGAHARLMQTYYVMGRSADVARHGIRAIALLEHVPFNERLTEFMYGEVYHMTADALSGQPNGRARLEQLNVQYRAAAIPSRALIAFDSAYMMLGRMDQRGAEQSITWNKLLGTQGAPLVAHYWQNMPTHDSATMAVNDGKIRVVELAHTGCLPCIEAVHGLQNLYQQFPTIEPVLLTWTFGYWGNRIVPPAEEIAHLVDYFATSTHITYPVGIWAGKRQPTEDDGSTVEESINVKHYPIVGKPILIVLDGHGIIRKVFTGYSRETHIELARTVDFLVRETAQGQQHDASMHASGAISSR